MRQPGKSWGGGIVRIRQRRHDQRLHMAHIKAIEMQHQIMRDVYGGRPRWLDVVFWVTTALCLFLLLMVLPGFVVGVM